MPSGSPTSKQLSYLRWLAQQTGTTFTPPRTVEEASSAIRQLRSRRRTSRGEVAREQRAIARDMATRRGDAAQVTAQELSGYGASARWAGMPAIAPRVVHCKREEYDVYVGRLPLPEDAPPGSDGFWGNPWKAGRDGTRAEVIERYERYVLSEPRMLERLPELRGKTLGCWCAPKPCHADVLLRMANERELPPPGRHPERDRTQGRPLGDGLGLG
jgi:Domain of unknown function (DUF4326)